MNAPRFTFRIPTDDELTAESYSQAELCEVLGVHRSTLHRWARSGVLEPDLGGGRRRRYSQEAVREWARMVAAHLERKGGAQ